MYAFTWENSVIILIFNNVIVVVINVVRYEKRLDGNVVGYDMYHESCVKNHIG